MPTSTGKGYLVRRLQDTTAVVCSSCGQSIRPLTAADSAVCSLHVVTITDSVRHYHRASTEVYYILQGRGKMELNEDVIDVEPGTVVHIEPGTRHRLSSRDGVQTLVFSTPPYRQDDEYYDDNP